jgi:hypothetical protein
LPKAPTEQLPLTAVVVKILERANRSGSIVEHGQCSAGSRVEEVHLVPSELAQQPLEKAIQQIEQRYPEIKWSGDGPDRDRVMDGARKPPLLTVRVREFLVIEDRPPQASLPALWRTAEVASYMRKHGMSVARGSAGAARIAKTAPTVIETKNATMEQILDHMVERYRSPSGRQLYRAWSYRECRRKGRTLVEIGFF